MRPEDFSVEEFLDFAPDGTGPHVFACVRRTGRTTPELRDAIVRRVGCRVEDVGFAGLKDRDAVVSQTFSIYAPSIELGELQRRLSEEVGVEVLSLARHGHKLRRGRLAGNRFRIRVSETGRSETELRRLLEAKWAWLNQYGVPNYFGEQRFGRDAGNVERAVRVLRGRERVGRELRELLVSALQSELFNRYLEARIRSGLFARLLVGDLAFDPGERPFPINDPASFEKGFAAGEVCYTGPMLGSRMPHPEGRPAALEEVVFSSFEAPQAIRRLTGQGGPPGTRRLARLFPGEVSHEVTGDSYEVSFTLPPGGFATVVLRELMEGLGAVMGPSSEQSSRPRLVIVDRDGVLNEDSDDYIRSVEEWHPLPGSLEALGRLAAAGVRVAVASNQSGIARGYFSFGVMEAIHGRLVRLAQEAGVTIERILVCPHGPDEGCACRKPQPGMLLEILRELNVPASAAVFIGDNATDAEAGRAAQVRTLGVLTGKGERTRAAGAWPADVPVFADLQVAVEFLLGASAGEEDHR